MDKIFDHQSRKHYSTSINTSYTFDKQTDKRKLAETINNTTSLNKLKLFDTGVYNMIKDIQISFCLVNLFILPDRMNFEVPC